VQERAALNVHAHRGVAVREYRLEVRPQGSADYLLFVDQEAVAGAIRQAKNKPRHVGRSGSERWLKRSAELVPAPNMDQSSASDSTPRDLRVDLRLAGAQ
jgi:hypothetical protein